MRAQRSTARRTTGSPSVQPFGHARVLGALAGEHEHDRPIGRRLGRGEVGLAQRRDSAGAVVGCRGHDPPVAEVRAGRRAG